MRGVSWRTTSSGTMTDLGLRDLFQFGLLILGAYSVHYLFGLAMGWEDDRAWHATFALGFVAVGVVFARRANIPISLGDKEVGRLRGRDAIVVGLVIAFLGGVMLVRAFTS